MDQLRELLRKPHILALVAFLAGLAIGWFAIGWGIWPVKWVDAPVHLLRDDIQEDIMVWAINSVEEQSNPQSIDKLVDDLGKPKAKMLLERVRVKYPNLDPEGLARYDALLVNVTASTEEVRAGALAEPTPASQTAGENPLPAAATPVTLPEGTANTPLKIQPLLLVMCVLTIAIAAALLYLFFFRPRRLNPSPLPREEPLERVPVPQAFMPSDQEPPVVQYMTTYSAGDDKYDDSFSIDSPTGEFMGECGVGISETIANGESRKVSAFEVWLFDKNDIQTVTKVLMSQEAFDDPSTVQRLSAKGEPVLAEPGKRILLETATLSLEARVVSMNYGQGSGLPAGSFFDLLSLELAVWPKRD